MTTTLLTPAPAAAPAGPARTASAVLALALVEGRRLLLSVPVLVALAACTAWTVWHTPAFQDGHPALQDADRATQDAPLLLALAVLLAVNRAVLRSRHRDTERHFAVLALGPGARTAAHALSLLPVTLVTALGVLAHFGYEALRPDAVGHGSPAELLTGPLTVLLFGTLGVLLARLLPSAVAAPVAVVLLFLVFVGGAMPEGDGTPDTRWLAPVVTESGPLTLPSDLLARPAAWHALYLAALALTLALLAVVRAGGRRPVTLGALAVAAALAVTGGTIQTGAVPADVVAARERATLTPEKEQSCARRSGVTYCAFPEWTSRTGRWAAVADQVRAVAGGTAHDRPLLVRQRVEARYGLGSDPYLPSLTAPHQVTVGTEWGGNRVPEFAVDVAGVLVAGDEAKAGRICDGRAVTVMWLALSGLPDPVQALRDVRLDDSATGSAIVLSQTEPHSMTEAQTEVVRALLDRPRAEVAAKVKAHWTELTTAKVTAAQAASLLGMPTPKGDDGCDV
ncbi:ABC transporter permease [Streptomyces griseoviridis]